MTDIAGAMRVTRALHLDALGSPTSETTATGGVTAVRQYDAWGQYRNGTAPGSSEAKYGYTGHQYDVETGLVYARARYYDAEYGRFLSSDSYEGSLNSAPSLHRFAYAHNNPLRYSDPNGRCVFGMTCEEMWAEATAPEPPGPKPATPVSPPPPPAPTPLAAFDWEASQDQKMRERFDDYLYRQQAPNSPELLGWGEREAQKQQWEANRTRARNVVEGMQTVENVSRWYLSEVAVPYLIVEGGGLLASTLGGVAVRAVARDLAAETQAAKELARIKKLEKFMAEQQRLNVAAAKRAEFGGQEAMAMIEPAAHAVDRLAAGSATTPVGELRAAGRRDAHHVIQDAAVRDLPGYDTNLAPGVQLRGPSNVAGTPHSLTRPVQRQAGGGSYAAERRIGYKALRRAGLSPADARQAVQEADDYFGSIGVVPTTSTRIPGDRK